MISTAGVTLQYGKRVLFENISISFSPGNCYGLIGANGSGKSSFLKILSGEIEPNSGEAILPPDKRLSILKQDHFEFDEIKVLDTVIMGHKELFNIMKAKDEIYAKENFSEADGIKASELEDAFQNLDGWSAEANAAELLSHLGVKEKFHSVPLKELKQTQKVRVLLAQALFGDPDVLLLDEPTNHLDVDTIMWLEEFLYNFKNTVIVVSHDRHFLDRVCTHTADIDFGKIQMYTGNYSFWYESSQLALRQTSDKNKKVEDKRKELQAFITRFSANASKSKQATARKKMLEKLTLTDIKPSSRKYPHINFNIKRDSGNDLLETTELSGSLGNKKVFEDLTLRINKGEKVAFVGQADLSITTLFQILIGEKKADSGTLKWGASTLRTYFPKDNANYFNTDLNLINWLRQYSEEQDEQFVRGFLGRMLFTGEESLKPANVLSGGEKVRCMLSRMMLQEGNVLILDEPTNHLDLESITALNTGMKNFKGTILFSSHDHELVQTVADRIIELSPAGLIDKQHTTYDEYLEDESIKAKRENLYPALSS